jgi:catechol 2,3-dioxygenase-like lactoylglutathione lyase family enzyme
VTLGHVSHLGLCVAALGPALAFWRDGLGFRETGRLDVAGEAAARLLGLAAVALRAVYLERDGLRIELLEFREPGHVGAATPRPVNQLGFSHLSLRVEDLDAALARLRAAGGRVLEETRIEQPARAVFVTDPDGARVELVERGKVD